MDELIALAGAPVGAAPPTPTPRKQTAAERVEALLVDGGLVRINRLLPRKAARAAHELLASLPERPFLGAGCDALKGDEATCVVCMSEYEEGETLSVLPGCAHTFHSQCVGRWLQEKPHCPVCMRDCRQDVQVA